MLHFDADRKKSNITESSSSQFNKYVDSINTLHPTPVEQYPGQFQSMGIHNPSKVVQDAKRINAEHKRLLHEQLVKIRNEDAEKLKQFQREQRGDLHQRQSSNPLGFMNASIYEQYKRDY